MPKASFAQDADEDEKTTIEQSNGGWEEEASTTVEQGEIAEKLRALGLQQDQRRGNTNITSTGGTQGGVSDEPTVDDQRGAAALAALPPTLVARLLITHGNDAGQVLEVRPGKAYTIGRGMGNDLVLTDIAVSRKHFDLRMENGGWVIADRGSGNGTLVNQRIEDAPFALSSGDVIEIGNTTFRFELPQSRGRPRRDVGDDENEPSTISGKMPGMPAQIVTPVAPIAPLGAALASSTPTALPRPKTLPPPAPRARTQSGRGAQGYGHERMSAPQAAVNGAAPLPLLHAPSAPHAPASPAILGSQQIPVQPGPASTLPLPQMANRAPLAPAHLNDPSLGGPSTIPGQGVALPGPSMHPARLPFHPQLTESQRQAAVARISQGMPAAGPPSQRMPAVGPPSQRQQMIVAAGMPPRDATSTALVQPINYGTGAPSASAPQPSFAQAMAPQISRRVKLAIGGVGLSVFAAVATIAVIKGSSGGREQDLLGSDAPAVIAPTVEPIRDAKPVVAPVTPPRRAPGAKPVAVVTTKPAESAPATTKPVQVQPAPVVTPAQVQPASKPEPAPVAQRTEPASKPEPAPAAQKPEPEKPAEAAPSRLAVVVSTSQPAPETRRHTEPKKPERAEPKKPERTEPKKPEKKAVAQPTPAREETRSEPTKKRSGKSTADVKAEAGALYRAKNFAGAASAITSALSGFSGDDAADLRAIAGVYSQLGKSYNVGMAPGTKPTDAFLALKRALDLDRGLGGALNGELQERMATTAARAAGSYMAAKEYESAFAAVRASERAGSSSPSNKTVRSMLETQASDLMREAQGLQGSDPDGAKKKLRQVLNIVDSTHPLAAKAKRLLGDG